MKRILLITAIAALTLAAIGVAGFLIAFNTSIGRGILGAVVEKQLAASIGGDVRIGALGGALPGSIVLRDIVFENEGAIWLRIDRVEMDWNAYAALRRRFDIERLAVSGARLAAPAPTRKREKPAGALEFLKLPRGLPNLSIRSLTIDDLEVDPAIAGQALRLDGEASVAMNDRAIDIRVDASSRSDTDTVNIAIALNPQSDHGLVDVLIASEADGFISSLAKLDGNLFLEARGSAPLADFSLDITGEIGAYGAIAAVVAGDLNSASALRVVATFAPGDRLDGLRRELGETLSFEGELQESEIASLITIDRFDSAAGIASGRIELNGERGSARTASGELDATFKEDYRSDLQALIGDEAHLKFDVTPDRSAFFLTAALSTPRAVLSIDNAKTDLTKALSGRVTFAAPASDSLPPPIDAGVDAHAFITMADGEAARLEELSLMTLDGSRFDGEIRWDNAREAIAIGGEASLSPALVARFAGERTPKEAIAARISASGPIAAITGELDLEIPRVAIEKGAIPASLATIRFTRTPVEIIADVTARPQIGDGTLIAKLSLRENGVFTVPSLDLKSPTFTLNGAGAYDRNREAADFDLAYSGAEGAEPWPGAPLAGEISIKGSLARSGKSNVLAVVASQLNFGDIAIGALEARASGASNALTFEASLKDMVFPTIGTLEQLQLTARANLSEPVTVSVSRLTGVIGGAPVKLTQPANLEFGEAITVDGLRAAFGETGSLSLDGSYSPDRWRATLSAINAPIPDQDAFATFKLDLDTDRKLLAHGDFTASSRLTASQASTIAGALAWDGQRLALTSADTNDPFQFNVALPLNLNRTPRLQVKMEGGMEGELAYAGPIEALAAYLPPSLQALEGAVTAEATLAGPFKNPELVGRIDFKDGAYTELGTGVSIDHINGAATAAVSAGATSLAFDFQARGLGQDRQTVAFTGSASLGENAEIDAVLKLDAARFAAGPVSSAVASGDVSISGTIGAVKAGGAVIVRELDANLTSDRASRLVDIKVAPIGGEPDNEETERFGASPVHLALKISGEDRIFVRGRGLESEWRADITATGDAGSPLIEGLLNLKRGHLDFAGRRFTLTRGQIAFDKYSPNNPILDLRAEHITGDGVTAIIEIMGRADSPKISLLSTPSLPAEDIMSIVLFGKPATELSALQSLQVAQAIAQLTGVGLFSGNGITGAARKALGVDMLSLDIDPETGSSALEVGKYVADGLFVSATQDVRGENGSVRIEYEITNAISIETELKQSGDQTVSANWKKDF